MRSDMAAEDSALAGHWATTMTDDDWDFILEQGGLVRSDPNKDVGGGEAAATTSPASALGMVGAGAKPRKRRWEKRQKWLRHLNRIIVEKNKEAAERRAARSMPVMEADEFRAILKECGLTVTAAARLLGITVRQAQRYGSGESVIPPMARKLIRLLEDSEVRRRLSGL